MQLKTALFMGMAIPYLLISPTLAQEFPGLQSLMTEEELRTTGLDRLSDVELRALDEWLADYTDEAAGEAGDPVAAQPVIRSPAPEEAPEPDDNYGQAPEREDIQTRIAGDFNGWEGRTRFRMENGQVWEQRRRSRWKISLDNPEVRIYQNWIGAWEMEVISEDRSIGVRRIR